MANKKTYIHRSAQIAEIFIKVDGKHKMIRFDRSPQHQRLGSVYSTLDEKEQKGIEELPEYGKDINLFGSKLIKETIEEDIKLKYHLEKGVTNANEAIDALLRRLDESQKEEILSLETELAIYNYAESNGIKFPDWKFTPSANPELDAITNTQKAKLYLSAYLEDLKGEQESEDEKLKIEEVRSELANLKKPAEVKDLAKRYGIEFPNWK